MATCEGASKVSDSMWSWVIVLVTLSSELFSQLCGSWSDTTWFWISVGKGCLQMIISFFCGLSGIQMPPNLVFEASQAPIWDGGSLTILVSWIMHITKLWAKAWHCLRQWCMFFVSAMHWFIACFSSYWRVEKSPSLGIPSAILWSLPSSLCHCHLDIFRFGWKYHSISLRHSNQCGGSLRVPASVYIGHPSTFLVIVHVASPVSNFFSEIECDYSCSHFLAHATSMCTFHMFRNLVLSLVT